MIDKLSDILCSIYPLKEKDKDDLIKITRSITLQPGDYWISEGTVNKNKAFLEKGYLRKFFLKDGKEITDFFYFDSDFCSDLPSIITNTLPKAYVIAMKPTVLKVFSFEDYARISQHSYHLEHLYRVILEQTFVNFYYRTTSFILHDE